MSTREEILARLDDVYDFPCPITFKVIGDNSERFHDNALAAIRRVAPEAGPAASRRTSSGGKHLALTFEVGLPTPESVLDVYEQLKGLEGLRMLL